MTETNEGTTCTMRVDEALLRDAIAKDVLLKLLDKCVEIGVSVEAQAATAYAFADAMVKARNG